MTDDVDESVDEASQSESEVPECGERLAEARRAQRITVFEIAKELHLDEPKVRALERNDFDVLGAPVFAKGHMRKYAQLVGVDIDDVLADYYRLTRASGMPPVVQERQKIKQEVSPGPWIAAVILILAAILSYWLIAMRTAPVAVESFDPESQDSESRVPEQQAMPLDELVVAVADDSSQTPVIGDPGDIPEFESETPEVAPASVTPQSASKTTLEQIAGDQEQMHLELNFTGECWTEISDADGRRLFFGMGNDGRTVEMSGKPPFSVLLGDAQNVVLLVNGNDYSISASNLRGRTARLTLQSTGS